MSTTDYPLTFSNRYCNHRELHSFPTRRSSDLFLGGEAGVGKTTLTAALTAALAGAAGDGAGGVAAPAVRDRKSTRLNSSHPSISYAVLCFKKKTRGQQSCSLACRPRGRRRAYS